MQPEEYVQYYFSIHGLEGRVSHLFFCQCVELYRTMGCEPEMIALGLVDSEGARKFGYPKPSKFKNAPLMGYWKQHIWLGGARLFSNIGVNIQNEAGHGMQDNRMKRILDEHQGKMATPELVREIVGEVVDGALDDRATRGGVSGDWAVFSKVGKRRRYLTLAFHGESNAEIHERIELAEQERLTRG